MSSQDIIGGCAEGLLICPFGSYLKTKADSIAEFVLNSMGNGTCGNAEDLECRNEQAALHLKIVGIFVILIASSIGVALPLVGKRLKCLRTNGTLFVVAKAFGAGVILATGFVHILPDAQEALTNECLPEIPWSKFPFYGFIAMLAAFMTLLADFVLTQFWERKDHAETKLNPIEEKSIWPELVHSSVEEGSVKHSNSSVGDGHTHIVGMRAHAQSHSHSHPHGHHSCADETHEHVNSQIGHSHVAESGSDTANTRHIVIAQILEMGIISHSIIIGLSMGVSESPCTIRPLIAALGVHQFFEGFALGGCVSQAGYNTLHSWIMAVLFALTTPVSIGIGTKISSIYNPNSAAALIVEGIFDSISAGILIYMALVDLIAQDFLSKGMACKFRLQCFSYVSLFLGGLAMASLAIWA